MQPTATNYCLGDLKLWFLKLTERRMILKGYGSSESSSVR